MTKKLSFYKESKTLVKSFWTDLQSGRTKLFHVCESFAPNGFITSSALKALIMADQTGNEVSETGRKRARRKESGSQTEDNKVNETCGGCCNMADTIIEMNRKLDLVLARMEEIDAIKEKQKQLEKVNADLEKSLGLSKFWLRESILRQRRSVSWRKV